MTKGSLRDQMPITAAWIDELRKVFGQVSIDGQIRKSMRGEPVFFASENGHGVGTPSPERTRIQWDARGRPYVASGPGAGQQEVEITKFAARERREQLKGVK
jgi:hypothetical protein